jgi:YidC/Oxa1 family membrane protein insertase
MDRNSIFGIILIAGIFIVWGLMNRPDAEELERQRVRNDSIQRLNDEIRRIQEQEAISITEPLQPQIDEIPVTDTIDAKSFTLENDLIKVTLNEMGARPLSVELKKYQTYDSLPLYLFDGDSSEFSLNYYINNKTITTSSLFFSSQRNEEMIVVRDYPETLAFRHNYDADSYLEFRYTLAPGKYQLDLEIEFRDMQHISTTRPEIIDLYWMIHSPRQEKGRDNELLYTTIYYRMSDGEVESFNVRSKKPEQGDYVRLPIEWIAYKDQFFSSVIMTDEKFVDAKISSVTKPEGSHYLKKFESTIGLPVDGEFHRSVIPVQFYFGPNKYKLLKKEYADRQLQELVTVGKSIIKWINQIVIINLFDFLNKYISNYGIIILILTIVIKMALLPLTFKSYMSTAKMKVLKPEIDKINEKIPKEKAMERQQATMKLYKQVGVSPLGGCLPMLLQMPILFAMFRFFPTSIELRQESFLWAHDLSTYDAIIEWSGNIPLITATFGNHLSLFTLLMTVSTILSMKFNNQASMSNQQMPGMQTMMYIMPVMFMFILNKYSAGLTYYYFLANMITFGQNYLFKQFIDEEALLAKLNSRKGKPVKKSRFQQRMEQMAKQQQAGKKPLKR